MQHGIDEHALLPAWDGRAILLVDLDAFFASVEQLDHPEWRGKPVIVGGAADKRGVVSTCSYEARTYGVRSAMPASTAARLCPDAIWVAGNFARYKEVSMQVMQILHNESPYVQQVSIDEAFVDITPTPLFNDHPVLVAQRIQQNVAELGVTCSIGLGISKSVAKVASDRDKPQGLTVVYPGREQAFLADLPLSCMSGIGPCAQERLAALGLRTLGDVAGADETLLKPIFGKNVRMMQNRCKGADTDEVVDGEPAKSVSNEISFAHDLTDRDDIEAALHTVCAKVARRLRLKELKALGVSVKVRYEDRTTRTQQCMLEQASNSEYEFFEALLPLLDDLWTEGMSIRLVGMAAYRFDEQEQMQASLFDTTSDEQAAPDRKRAQLDELAKATDSVRNRFGEHAVMFGREISTMGNLTGSSSKNPHDYKE